MASIRQGGGIGVRSTPVTTTAPSTLDNVLGFMGQVANAGAAMRGLAERRNNEKIASETAKANSYIVNYDDQLQGLRLKFSDDYTGFQDAAKPIRDEMAAWVEANITTEEGKAHFAMKEEALFNRAQDPILAASSAANAEQRERDAQEAAVKFLPKGVTKIAEALAGTDKVAKQHASLEVANAIREIQNPDGAVAQTFGATAAAKQAAGLMKRVDRATAMAIIGSNHEKDLPRLYEQWKGDGFAKGDGSFYGSSMTETEREDVWSDAMRARRYKDDFIAKQEAAADDRREERAGQLYLQAVIQGRNRGEVDEGLLASLAAADPGKAAEILTTDWSRTALTRGEAEAATAAEGQVNAMIAGLDPSDPASLGVIETMRVGMAQDRGLHFSTKNEIEGMLNEARADVIGYADLPPDVQAKMKGRAAVAKATRTASGDMVNPNQSPMVVAELLGEYDQMIDDPTFPNGVAQRLVLSAATIPDGDTAGAVMRMLRDPHTRAAARADPAKFLGIIPGMADADVYQLNDAGEIDYVKTVGEMQDRGMDQADAPDEDDEDALSQEALGQRMQQGRYATTLAVLKVLAEANTMNIDIDEKALLEQDKAKRERDAIMQMEAEATGANRRRLARRQRGPQEEQPVIRAPQRRSRR